MDNLGYKEIKKKTIQYAQQKMDLISENYTTYCCLQMIYLKLPFELQNTSGFEPTKLTAVLQVINFFVRIQLDSSFCSPVRAPCQVLLTGAVRPGAHKRQGRQLPGVSGPVTLTLLPSQTLTPTP